MSEQRKAELRERLRCIKNARLYPCRGEATFTDENDHNPLVLARCPKCGGHTTIGIAGPPGIESDVTCPACGGAGTNFEVEPYYPEAVSKSELIDVAPNAHGWLECPRCNRRFLPTDGNVWTGLRHRPCGQKIRIVAG